MYYGNMKYNDIANGIGVRTSLFVSGCRHHCKGCFQPQTWDFDYGKPFTKEEEEKIAASLRRDSRYWAVNRWKRRIRKRFTRF